jgi:hypothetical protein
MAIGHRLPGGVANLEVLRRTVIPKAADDASSEEGCAHGHHRGELIE